MCCGTCESWIHKGSQMVNPDQILKLFQDNFEVAHGNVVVNDQGIVDVYHRPKSPRCVVYLTKQLTDGVLPVAFGSVEGTFDASRNNVKTLKNFPKVITGNLYTEGNRNLRQFYDFDIQHIDGIWYTDYRQSQHLLKMLVAPKIQLTDAPRAVNDILNTHAGKGRVGALKAAVELVKAGYKENAKW